MLVQALKENAYLKDIFTAQHKTCISGQAQSELIYSVIRRHEKIIFNIQLRMFCFIPVIESKKIKTYFAEWHTVGLFYINDCLKTSKEKLQITCTHIELKTAFFFSK